MSHAVVVLGMHRGGTSTLMRVLNCLGVQVGENLLPATPDNEKGFWEHQNIFETHEHLLHTLGSSWDEVTPLPKGWWRAKKARPFKERLIEIIRRDFDEAELWGFKDPRTARLLPLWLEIFEELVIQPHFVIISRNPIEVARSLAKRDSFAPAKSYLLWLRHLVEAERGTREWPRAFVTYDEVVSSWRQITTRVGRQIGLRWPTRPSEATPDIESFLDPALRHQVSDDRAVDAAPELSAWVKEVYKVMKAGVRSRESKLPEIVDVVEAQLAEADKLFPPAFSSEVQEARAAMAGFHERLAAVEVSVPAQDAALRAASVELRDEMTASLGPQQARIDALELQLTGREEESRAALAGLNEQLATLAGLPEKLSALGAAVPAQEEALRATSAELRDEMTASLAPVQPRIDAIEDHLASREAEARATLAGLGERLATLEAAVPEQEAALRATSDELRGEMAASLAPLQGRIDALESQLADRTEEARALAARVAAHEERLASDQEQLASHREQLEVAGREAKERGRRIEELERDAGSLREAATRRDELLESHSRRLEDLSAALATREAELAEARRSIAARRVELGEAQRSIAAEKVELEEAQRSIAAGKVELEEAQRSIAAGKVELGEAQRSIAAGKAELGEAQRSIAAESSRVEGLNRRLEETTGALSSLQQTVAAAEQREQERLAAAALAEQRRLGARLRRVFLRALRWLAAPVRGPLAKRRDLRLLSQTPLFDRRFYMRQNPDIPQGGSQAVRDYYHHALRDQRDPNPFFSTSYYLERNPDVARLGANPLIHYLRCGSAEGRDPGPLFDTSYYRDANPDVARSGMDPLGHFILCGIGEGRQPAPAENLLRLVEPYALDPARSGCMDYLEPAETAPGRASDVRRIGIHASSEGNPFYRDIRDMLVRGFAARDVDAVALDETSDGEGLSHRILVAPQELFYLGEGQRWTSDPRLDSAILLNPDLQDTGSLARALPYLFRARLVLDMNPQVAAALRDLGIDAHFLPLGPLEGFAPFDDEGPLPDEQPLEALPAAARRAPADRGRKLQERPIDVLFLGTASERRERFLAGNAGLLGRHQSFVHVFSDTGPRLAEDGSTGLSARAMVGLAQRSKVLLHVHRDEVGTFEWQRLVMLGIWQRTLVVTERSFRVPWLEPGEHYLEGDVDELPQILSWVLETREGQERAEEIRKRATDALTLHYGLDSVLDALLARVL